MNSPLNFHKSHKPRYAFLLFIAFVLTSCHQNPVASHTLLVDQILAEASKKKDGLIKDYVDSAFNIFSPSNDDLKRKYIFLRSYYHNRNHLELFYEYVDSGFYLDQPYYKESGLKTYQMVSKINLMDSLWDVGLQWEAIETFSKVKKIMETTKDSSGFYSLYYNSIGYRYFQNKDYKKALNNYKFCLANPVPYKTKYEQYLDRQMYLDNIALCYHGLDQFDSALLYYNLAEKCIDSVAAISNLTERDISAKGVIYGNRGSLWFKKRNYGQAEKELRKSIEINIIPGREVSDASYAIAKLAKLYFTQNRIPEVAKELVQLRSILNPNADPSVYIDYYDLMSKLQALKGDYRAANINLNKSASIMDSIEKSHKFEVSSNIQTGLDLTERVRKLDMENQNKEKQVLIGRIFSVGAVIAIVITVIVWGNFKRTKKIVQQLTQSNIDLKEANDHLDQSQNLNKLLTNIICHDLQGPISMMQNFSMLKKAHVPIKKDEEEKFVELLEESCTSAKSLISDLMFSTSITDELSLGSYDLSSIIDYSIEQVKEKARSKNQTLQFAPISINVIVDKQKIWRVFYNLCNNAIKFSASGTTIHISMEKNKNATVVHVRDAGIGIPENIADKIFMLKNESKRLGTQSEPSFGLGLYISKQIIDAHGGQIWFTSPQDGGTVFHVSIPDVSDFY